MLSRLMLLYLGNQMYKFNVIAICFYYFLFNTVPKVRSEEHPLVWYLHTSPLSSFTLCCHLTIVLSLLSSLSLSMPSILSVLKGLILLSFSSSSPLSLKENILCLWVKQTAGFVNEKWGQLVILFACFAFSSKHFKEWAKGKIWV